MSQESGGPGPPPANALPGAPPAEAPEEREVKIRVANAADVVSELRRLGAKPLGETVLEDDTLMDDAAGTMRSGRRVLRLRVQRGAGGAGPVVRTAITFKGPPRVDAGMRVREELETEIKDASTLALLLERLGYRPVFRYQKRRQAFRFEGAIVAVDQTPLGDFVEVEGDTEAVDAAASRLGHGRDAYLTDSYPGLWRRLRPGRPTAMLFDDQDPGPGPLT